MKIILMRHGEPCFSDQGFISPAEMKTWVEAYNQSKVITSDLPQTSIKLANSATHFVSSPAPRAVSSLQALGHSPTVIDAIFSEAQLPHSHWQYPRLPAQVWAAIFRLLWFCGYSQGLESYPTAKKRAKVAANQLVMLAKSGTVLLMGHGIMNSLIANELRKLSWEGPFNQSSNYWQAHVYNKA